MGNQFQQNVIFFYSAILFIHHFDDEGDDDYKIIDVKLWSKERSNFKRRKHLNPKKAIFCGEADRSSKQDLQYLTGCQ